MSLETVSLNELIEPFSKIKSDEGKHALLWDKRDAGHTIYWDGIQSGSPYSPHAMVVQGWEVGVVSVPVKALCY